MSTVKRNSTNLHNRIALINNLICIESNQMFPTVRVGKVVELTKYVIQWP